MFDIKQALKSRSIDSTEWMILKSVFPAVSQDVDLIRIFDYAAARNLNYKSGHVIADYKPNFSGFPELQIMVSIAGYRHTAHSSGEFAGIDEPVEGPYKAFNVGGVIIEAPEWISVTVYRMVDGVRCPTVGKERFLENVPCDSTGKPCALWRRRPAGQLAFRAEAQAHRKAFSGCDSYTEDEMTAVYDRMPSDGAEVDETLPSAVDNILAGYARARTPAEITAVSAEADKIRGISQEEYGQMIEAFEAATERMKSA